MPAGKQKGSAAAVNGQQGKDVKNFSESDRKPKGRRLLCKSRRGAALLLAGALTATNAGAETHRTYASAQTPSSSYYVSAPVVNVSPITSERTIQHPIRQCTRETYREDRYEHRHREENLFLPGLFGGIVGGLIGNQFGGGSGKKGPDHRRRHRRFLHRQRRRPTASPATAGSLPHQLRDRGRAERDRLRRDLRVRRAAVRETHDRASGQLRAGTRRARASHRRDLMRGSGNVHLRRTMLANEFLRVRQPDNR